MRMKTEKQSIKAEDTITAFPKLLLTTVISKAGRVYVSDQSNFSYNTND